MSHVQVQAQSFDDMGRKNLSATNSLPTGLAIQNSPPKGLRFADNGFTQLGAQGKMYQQQMQQQQTQTQNQVGHGLTEDQDQRIHR